MTRTPARPTIHHFVDVDLDPVIRDRLLGFAHRHGLSWSEFMSVVLRQHITSGGRSCASGFGWPTPPDADRLTGGGTPVGVAKWTLFASLVLHRKMRWSAEVFRPTS